MNHNASCVNASYYFDLHITSVSIIDYTILVVLRKSTPRICENLLEIYSYFSEQMKKYQTY
jgi:hypothetical protein